jgi:RNA polymerase sigma-70 factor (ECF subfamily)
MGQALGDGLRLPPPESEPSAEAVVSELFREMAPKIRRWVIYQHGPDPAGRDLADEVLAETFLVVWNRKEALSSVPAERRAWVFGIAANILRQHVKKSIRARAAEAAIQQRPQYRSTPVEDHLAEADHVRQILGTLPPAEREAFTLTIVSDLSPTQISQVLGCSPGTIRSRLSRARARLSGQPSYGDGKRSKRGAYERR